MSEHKPGNSESSGSIEHLDFKPEAESLQEQSEMPNMTLLISILERLDEGEEKADVLGEYGGWEGLEIQLGSRDMQKLFGNRKEYE